MALEAARFFCVESRRSSMWTYLVDVSLACSIKVFNTAVWVSTVFWRFCTACCRASSSASFGASLADRKAAPRSSKQKLDEQSHSDILFQERHPRVKVNSRSYSPDGVWVN